MKLSWIIIIIIASLAACAPPQNSFSPIKTDSSSVNIQQTIPPATVSFLSTQQAVPEILPNFTPRPSLKGKIVKDELLGEKIQIWKNIAETEAVGELTADTEVSIIGEAVRNDGKPFYQIEVEGMRGWIAQGLIKQ